jgi:hypothetical protein
VKDIVIEEPEEKEKKYSLIKFVRPSHQVACIVDPSVLILVCCYGVFPQRFDREGLVTSTILLNFYFASAVSLI